MKNTTGALFLAALSIAAVVGTNVNGQNANANQPKTNEQPAPTATNASPKKTSRLDREVCRREELIGTRLKAVKVCRTAREWRDIERGHQKSIRDLQDKPQASEQSRG